MFVDASALVAVINREPGWEEIVKRLAEAQNACFVSPLVRFEATLAVARAAAPERARANAELIASAREIVDDLVAEIGAEDTPITVEIGDFATIAASVYGKAVGHPADLNFGDCFAYACAKARRVGLIYKGNDFAHTDLA